MKSKIFGSLILLILLVVFTSMYQVSEIEQAVVLRFGKPVGGSIINAGLKFKMPFIDDVLKFDKRILEYDSAPKELITKDKKNVVVDNYAKWKINDPLLFLQRVQNQTEAQKRLDDIIYSELRQVLGNYTFLEVISTKREEIMDLTSEQSREKLSDLGIDLVDVRIKRVDLPKENEENIYKRMEAERQEQAKKYRAEGQQKALEIISTADKERAIELSKAYKEAQIIKGEAEEEAARIYAEAYNVDIEFYKFVRSLESYEKIFNSQRSDKLILSTDSELWKYLSE